MNSHFSSSRQWTIQRFPWVSIIILIGLIAFFVLAVEKDQLSFIVAIPLVAGIIAVLGFSEYVICEIDLDCQRVTLQRMQIWRTIQREFSFKDLQAVSVNEISDSDGSTYRLAFILKSGELLPFTSMSSSGKRRKQKMAQKIIQYINQVQYPPVDAALDGIVRMQQSGETAGIRWQMEIISDNESPPKFFWQTKAGKLAGGFLMVIPARRVFGVPFSNWALRFFRRMNYKRLVNLFKMRDSDLPDLDLVIIIKGDEFGLGNEFMILTDNQQNTKKWLTRNRVRKLTSWNRDGSRHAGTAGNNPYLLVSEHGMSLVVYGNMKQLEAIAHFGSDLAR